MQQKTNEDFLQSLCCVCVSECCVNNCDECSFKFLIVLCDFGVAAESRFYIDLNHK